MRAAASNGGAVSAAFVVGVPVRDDAETGNGTKVFTIIKARAAGPASRQAVKSQPRFISG